MFRSKAMWWVLATSGSFWLPVTEAGTYETHGTARGQDLVSGATTPSISGGVQAGQHVVWDEDFEGYVSGQDLHGINGWKGWDNDPGVSAQVTNAANHTGGGRLSVDIEGPADLVREYANEFGATENSGQWVYRAWQFVPSNMSGKSYFIMQNTYDDGGPYNWSVTVHHDVARGTIQADYGGEELPLFTDEWISIRIEIDLDTDLDPEGLQSYYYDGIPLYESVSWSDGIRNGNPGLVQIGSVDLFANGATSTYYDDLELEHLNVSCRDPEWCCDGDVDGSCNVGPEDFGYAMAFYGSEDPEILCQFDMDCNNIIDDVDLDIIFELYGTCNEPRIACSYPCEHDWPCDGDFDRSGHVNPLDVALVFAAIGSRDTQDLCRFDMDCSRVIDETDAFIVRELINICNPPRPVCGECRRVPTWRCNRDVDGDGQVNPVDYGLVQAAFGSTNHQDLCNYDVDCDGQINPVDAGLVQTLFGICDPPDATCP